jgi:hypothetical protein
MSKPASQLFKEYDLRAGAVVIDVYPGLVMSVNDGDHHFISAEVLLRLWGIDIPVNSINDYKKLNSRDYYPREKDKPNYKDNKVIHLELYPDPSGDYNLEKLLQIELFKAF